MLLKHEEHFKSESSDLYKCMEVVQNFRYNGGWSSIKLTQSDIEKISELHREHTVKVMKECLEDAGLIFQNVQTDRVACALFEARSEKFFTWVVRVLQDKVKLARSNGGIVVEEERVVSSSSGGD